MGLGSGSARDRESRLDPPYFYPDGDLQDCRRKIALWVDLIKSAAERGVDGVYVTVYATLGRQLYDLGFPSTQRSIVHEAQIGRTIDS